MFPKTQYARSGEINIAYQVIGQKDLDLVFVPGWVSNVECTWEDPSLTRFLTRLASFSRLIIFDKRGTGLSDPVSELPTLEKRMDDVRAVLDAVGSTKAALLGVSGGGPMCALFAATYPQRTSALIMYGSYARKLWDPAYPWAPTLEQRQKFFDTIQSEWGGTLDIETLAPSRIHDESFKEWWAKYLRRGASPSMAMALAKMNNEIDVRNILSAIHIPTLIIHRKDDKAVDVNGSRYISSKISNARYVELSGSDHLCWTGNPEPILKNIEEFLTGSHNFPVADRVLATVMFTDIVGSTEKASQSGDLKWKDILRNHKKIIRKEIEAFRGKEMDSTGDGFFATFDGPARAIRCAIEISNAVRTDGIDVRIGIHTGECELIDDKLGGIAVHIGARVMSKAGPGEIFVSSVVKELVAGSGLLFEDKGVYNLKGVPGEWKLYSVIKNSEY